MSSILRGRHLPRRTFLRGVGAAVALPVLDAMIPVRNAAAATAASPLRMAFVYVPNGIIGEGWKPGDEGRDFALDGTLEPLRGHRDNILILSGLAHANARALGDGGGDHARAAASFLTGVHPRKTAGANIQNGISVDQVAAQLVGQESRFPSLEFTLERGRLAGRCDSGYSCAYVNSLSWRTPTTPNPPESSPRLVFQRLFGSLMEDPEVRSARSERRRSILDFVLEDAHRIKKNLGPTDQQKLEEYLYAVRGVEKRIQSVGDSLDIEDLDREDYPQKPPTDYAEYARIMFDLQALALRTDQTRIVTTMIAREGSNRVYKQIGVPDAHHAITHHQGDAEKIANVRKINTLHVQMFSQFLDTLSSIEDGDGTLLDHSMIVYGSGISDGNRHRHSELPIILAGHGGGLNSGRHVRYEKDTPMTNLFLSMLERMGVPTETLGDSSGTLEHLSEI